MSENPLPRAGWNLRDMVWASLTALVLVVGGAVFASIAVFVLAGLGVGASTRLLTLIIFGLEAVLIIPAWIWGPQKYGGGWPQLGLRRAPLVRSIVLVVVGLAIVIAVNVAWDAIRQRIGLAGQPEVLPLFGSGPQGLALALLLGGVVAPVAEEIFFRGFLYAGFRHRWGVGWGMLASSVVFALVHITPGVLLPIFIIGLVLAFLYEHTQSLWPNIVLHAAINSIAFVSVYAAAQGGAILAGY